MRGFEHHAGERLHRVKPAAMDADIEFARIAAIDGQPVDEFGVGQMVAVAAAPPSLSPHAASKVATLAVAASHCQRNRLKQRPCSVILSM